MIKPVLIVTLLLGFMLTTAYGQDFEATKQAAEKGDPAAQVQLGTMYNSGEKDYGVPKNNAEAAKWYKLAADQNHAGSLNHLGWYYYTGEGVAKNDAEAVRLYRLAVVQGHAHSQFNLAIMYENGAGVPQDSIMAFVWYSLAIAHNGAAESRDKIKATLSPEQLVKAEQIAARCLESKYKDCN